MSHLEATRILPLPLAEVETRLRDVESWTNFLAGVGSIRYVSHERYVFTLADGRDHRELPMVVKLRYRDHCFVWHGVSGSALRGSIKLVAVDERRTAVTLTVDSYPADFRAGVAEMLMPHNSRADVDLKLMEQHLLGFGHGGHQPAVAQAAPDPTTS